MYNLGLNKEKDFLKERVCMFLNKKTIMYKPLLFELIDCIYEIQNTMTFTEKHLKILENGVTQSNELIFCDYSGKYLCHLSHYFENVKELILRLAQDKQSKIRFNIISIMLYKPPFEIIEKVLIDGLFDKSDRIILKSADIALRLQFKSVYKYFDEVIVNLNDKNVSAFKFYRNLAIDGYILEKSDNWYNLIVLDKEGSIVGKSIFENDLPNLESIIYQLRGL